MNDFLFPAGVKVIFRVGLVLLKYGLRNEVIRKCPSMYETLQALKNIEPDIMSEQFLLFQVSYSIKACGYVICHFLTNDLILDSSFENY